VALSKEHPVRRLLAKTIERTQAGDAGFLHRNLVARDISCIVCVVWVGFQLGGIMCPASEKCVQALEIRELARRVREVVLSPSADRHVVDFELWASELEQEAADLERKAAVLPA
jgi:hypothetical protein